jgi:hypothetical protein
VAARAYPLFPTKEPSRRALPGWSLQVLVGLKVSPMCRSARREIVVAIKDMVAPYLIIPQVVIPARIFARSVGGPSCGLVMQALWEA